MRLPQVSRQVGWEDGFSREWVIFLWYFFRFGSGGDIRKRLLSYGKWYAGDANALQSSMTNTAQDFAVWRTGIDPNAIERVTGKWKKIERGKRFNFIHLPQLLPWWDSCLDTRDNKPTIKAFLGNGRGSELSSATNQPNHANHARGGILPVHLPVNAVLNNKDKVAWITKVKVQLDCRKTDDSASRMP